MDTDIKLCDGHMVVKVSGNAQFAAFIEMHEAIISHDDWTPGTPILLDYTDLNSASLTINDIRTIANDVVEKGDRIGQSRCAFCVSRDLEFGLVRMWMVFVELELQMTTQVFRSRNEAVDWLSA